MESEYFVYRIIRNDGKGYRYGVRNIDHEKWAANIMFRGTSEQCRVKQQELTNINDNKYGKN